MNRRTENLSDALRITLSDGISNKALWKFLVPVLSVLVMALVIDVAILFNAPIEFLNSKWNWLADVVSIVGAIAVYRLIVRCIRK